VGPNLIGEIQMSEIPKNIKKLALSRDLKATIRIGKSGITENLIAEISDQLSTKSIVKIKINRGLFDKSDLKNLWLHLEISTNSRLVSSRGNVGVLWKP
jgi:RNA-binding protein YhbY